MDKMQREDAESMPREMASSSCGKNSSLFWTAPQGSSASRNVDVYHSKTNLWRTLEHLHLPAPRAGAGVVCLGGRLYVCGGSDGTQAMRTVWSIDPEELDGTNDMPLCPSFYSPLCRALWRHGPCNVGLR